MSFNTGTVKGCQTGYMTPCRKDSTSEQHLIDVQLALQVQEMHVDRIKLGGIVPCCSQLAFSVKGLLIES